MDFGKRTISEYEFPFVRSICVFPVAEHDKHSWTSIR